MTTNSKFLLVAAGERFCAIPLPQVIETMRPLAVIPVPGAPDFVLGVSVVRGAPAPVIGAAQLFGGGSETSSRFVSLRAGAATLLLAVDNVLGVSDLDSASFASLPPILRDVVPDAVRAIRVHDRDLVSVLDSGRLLPPELIASLRQRSAHDEH